MSNNNIGTLLTTNVSRPPRPSYLPIIDDVNSPSSAKLCPTHSREKLSYGGRPNPRSKLLPASIPTESQYSSCGHFLGPHQGLHDTTRRLSSSRPPSGIWRDCRGLALSLHRSPIGGAYSNISQPPYTAMSLLFHSIYNRLAGQAIFVVVGSCLTPHLIST